MAGDYRIKLHGDVIYLRCLYKASFFLINICGLPDFYHSNDNGYKTTIVVVK